MHIPLNIKTNYSLLSSLNDIEHLIHKAKSLNIKTLGITDSNMYGVMDFYKECLKNDIKPIIGIDIEIEDKHVLLYAMNYEGYQNLTRLVFLKQDQVLTLNQLKEYKDNLLCIVLNSSLSIYDELKSIYKHIYLGYSNLDERTLMKEKGKTVFVNEVLYLNKSDKQYLKYLYLIKDGKKIINLDEYNIDSNHHLMSLGEVLDLSIKEDLKWMEEINNICNIYFESNPHLMPKYNSNKDFDSKVYLHSLCKLGLQKRLENKVSTEYVDRLKYELDVIDKMGFNDYFLVVYDFIKYANRNNIFNNCRGSAAGSLVSYCLGITNIDPLRYDLLFERFLNPERITMPDIDIDFESTKRGEVVNYVISKYGKRRAMPIITFVTLSGKQAIRDIARIFDYNSLNLDSISKNIDSRYSLRENYERNDSIKRLLNNDIDLYKIYEIAIKIEGAKRQISVHAAGIVISKLELDSYIPLQKYDDYYITGYSMEHLEELGLIKMDFLGLKNFTLIEGVTKDIIEQGEPNFSFNSIPLNDAKTLELFAKALTEGIFQFETAGMKSFIRKLKPSSFEEIVAAIALFRPGPMDNIDSYIRRKEGREKIDYLHPDLESILKPTYGIIVYQEQIMQIAHIMAGYSFGEADILRRAMSKKKKEVLIEEENKFMARCIEKGYSEDIATKVYNLILKFANYGFNRGHSVAYSVISYKMGYLKVHYTKYFMSNLLTNVIGDDSKTKVYIDECRNLNINILKPDINLSDYCYKVEGNDIRFSLAAIRNVGSITCREIVRERQKREFIDFFDFVGRTYGHAVNRKTLESLIDASAFDSFGYNHQTLIYNIDNAITYAELVSNMDASLVEKPIIGVTDEMNKEELGKREVSVFGFYLSNHPVTEYKAKEKNIVNLNDVKDYFDKLIDVIVYVDKIKEIMTKNNEKMAFITVSDELSSIDLVLFPSVYKESDVIHKGAVLKAKVRVEKRMSRYQLSASKVEILSDL